MSNSFHEKFARDIKTSRERELPFVGRIKEKLDKEFMGGFPPAKINWFAVFFTCLTTLEALCKTGSESDIDFGNFERVKHSEASKGSWLIHGGVES